MLAHPLRTLLFLLLIGALAAWTCRSLSFNTQFSALLPEDAPEINELNTLIEKAGGTVELIIAVSGKDTQRRLAFARRIAARLSAQPWIRRADAEYPVEFFQDRALLMLNTDQLKRLSRSIDQEIHQAKLRANPLYIDLEDPAEPGARKTRWTELKHSAAAHAALPQRTLRSPDDKYLFIRVKPMGMSINIAEGKRLFAQIKALVTEAQSGETGLAVRYAGSLVIHQEQHTRMTADLRRASIAALVLILLLLTLYVRRLAAPLILALPLILSLTITLAITTLIFGQLNLVTGFLITALCGLGIDFEIHLYLRYLEELDRLRQRHQAMAVAIKHTLPACLTSSLTTAAAFFAMAISDFRGFREYGVIAGVGVLISLIVTYLALPPLGVLLGGRGRPRPATSTPTPGRLRRPFAWAMVLSGVGVLIFSFGTAGEVRWHTDFRELRGDSEKVDFSYYVGDLLGGSLTPAGILVQNLDQAREVQAYLDQQMKQPDSPIRRHLSLASLIPPQADQAMPIIKRIRASLQQILEKDLKPKDRQRAQDALALTEVKPWTISEVPAPFTRPFWTIDGQASFVYVWPSFPTHAEERVIQWGQALQRFQTDLRAKGLSALILDEKRMGARVLQKMRADAPLVLGAAALAVLLVLLIDFRDPRRVLLVASILGVGISWMLGLMALWGVEINVFNQAVLATIIGVGIDNVVHIQHRYATEGPGSIPRVVATTGSAALLASLTTAIGFGAAISAHHLGIRSLGWLSLVGLGCAFVASTIFFPALLHLLERPAGRAQ